MANRKRKRERFPIGEWSRQVKSKREVLVQANQSLQNIQSEIADVSNSYEKLKNDQILLEGKVSELKRKRGLLENEKVHMPKGRSTDAISTKLDKNNSDKVIGISHNLARKRRKLTYAAVQNIHATAKDTNEEAKTATKCGLWHTLVTSFPGKDITKLCKKSNSFGKNVIPTIVKSSVAKFEKSPKNLIRSVSVLYRGGMLSKRKYSAVRSSEIFDYDVLQKKRKRTEFDEGCKVPALVPYKDLMKFVGEQNIGKLNNIPRALAEREIEKENEEVSNNFLPLVHGHYIALEERLLQLADLYLYIESQVPSSINWLGREKGHFLVALGADGAPFGKSNEACSWLVSLECC